MYHVRDVFVRDAECLAVQFGIEVHLNSPLGVLSIQVALFSLAIVAAFEVEFGLVHEYLGDAFRVELPCDLEGGVPVLLVLVHVDGLLGLVGLDELLLCFLESVLILQMKRILKVDFRKLIFGMRVSQCEGLIELILIGFKIDGSLN